MRRLSLVLATLLLPVLSSTALAQQVDAGVDEGSSSQLFSISCGTSTTTGVLAGIGYWIIGNQEEELRKEVEILKQVVRLERYLEHNEVALRGTLAMGAGPELRELLSLMGHMTPLTRAQRAQLRVRRADLLRALSGQRPARASRVHALLTHVLSPRAYAEVTP